MISAREPPKEFQDQRARPMNGRRVRVRHEFKEHKLTAKRPLPVGHQATAQMFIR